MALSKDRNTVSKDGSWNADPVAAGVKIYAGSLVALNAAGFAVPATAVAANRVRGVSSHSVDNSAGANGAVRINTDRAKAFLLSNYNGEATRANIGAKCYVVDDETVSTTDGGGARPAAGTILDVEGNGVWVLVN